MVSDRMGVGRGDECRQAAQEVERLEDQAGGTLGMWPGPAQMIEDAAVVTQNQAFLGKGRPQAVTAQALETFAVLGGHGLRPVEREAGHADTQGLPDGWGSSGPCRLSCPRGTGAWTATARAGCRAAVVCSSRA